MFIDLSGEYYIREVFHIGDVLGTHDLRSGFLDSNNCKVVNKTLGESFVILSLKRDSDGMEGKSYIKVKPEFSFKKKNLLTKFFANKEIMHHTLNEIRDIRIFV